MAVILRWPRSSPRRMNRPRRPGRRPSRLAPLAPQDDGIQAATGKPKMDLGNGLGHLTYSTLVHPADNWEQLYHSLVTYLPKVKARVAGNKSFGVCIRLSANSAATLAASAAKRDK